MSPKERKWARVKRAGAHGMRRGAWYAVLNENVKIMSFEPHLHAPGMRMPL